MPQTILIVNVLLAALAVLDAGTASGQAYPSKPVRILTGEVSGGNDFVARVVAQGLTAGMGRQFIVDNRIGSIPGQIVSKAPPDGHTLLVGTGSVWLLPFMQRVAFDPIRDFAPVTLVGRSPNILVVNPALPAKSVRDLIALAKATPGALNYGSASTGSAVHLAAELFKSMADVNIVRVLYKGSGPAVVGLLSGEVQLMFATPASVNPHIKSGKLRALAVTSTNPSELAPGLAPVAASGLSGYSAEVLYGIWSPAGTPAPVLRLLNQNIVSVLKIPDVKDKFLGAGIEAVGSSADEFAATIKSDMTRMGKVIKDAGISAD